MKQLFISFAMLFAMPFTANADAQPSKPNIIIVMPDDLAYGDYGCLGKLRAAYDKWWNDVQPLLVNEDVTPVKINPFQELYYKQFGGSPSEQDLAKMSGNPQRTTESQPSKQKDRAAQRRKAREQTKTKE